MTTTKAKIVVVIGAGSAGLSVAAAAAGRGALVHLVEKQDRIGGMLYVASGEFSGAGSRRQAARGIEDSPTRHFEEVVRLSHGRLDKELTWLSVQSQGRTVDWLEDLGFEFDDACPGLVHGHEVYDVPRTYWGVQHGASLLAVLRGLVDPLVEQGRIRLHLGTRAKALHREAGHVTAVEVDRAGSKETIPADAVVLATGGYDANVALRNRFLPEHCQAVLVGCLDHATGDGLVMAETIGAQVSADGIFLPVMGLIPDPARPHHAIDYRDAFIEMAPAHRIPHEIWVNTAGRRFVAEDTTSPERRERALLDQPDNTMHVVFDAGALETAPVSLVRNPADEWTTARFREACAVSPWVTRADSVEDLARALGIDAPALVATIDAYNRSVESHTDELGRKAFPRRLDRGPWYAITSAAASILSRDGLAVNTRLNVLTADRVPIDGLYAVGEVLGNNTFAGDNYVGGMSITPAVTLGRMLGEWLTESVESEERAS